MLGRWLYRQHPPHLKTLATTACPETRRGLEVSSRRRANAVQDGGSALAKTRNIGIIAHIDAVCIYLGIHYFQYFPPHQPAG